MIGAVTRHPPRADDLRAVQLPIQQRARSTQRPCGGCTACCHIMAVEELRKPMYAACQHCGPAGCSIYGTHPPTCSQWQCLWAAGVLEDADRPDRCGLMFEQSIINGVPVISIHEVIPHALEARQRVSKLIEKIQQFGLRTDEIHEWPYGTRGATAFVTDRLTYPNAPSGPVKRVPRGNNWYRMIPARAMSA